MTDASTDNAPPGASGAGDRLVTRAAEGGEEAFAARVQQHAPSPTRRAARLPRRAPGAAPGTSVEIRPEAHTPADRHLPDTARRIRRAVHETAEHELGVPVTLVDVVVTDVITPADIQEEKP
ncbi:hypothetical protein ACFQ7A_03830 [Streptomyces sp. NPDC056528]|uniref:hypothetical protein n=1 Tax=Streptomyces sp. NPDC056528 TaxID=3345854 RepID=UPI0036D06F42